MKIEIKNRYDNSIILCGEYENIKDCLEKNRGANLEGANLTGANLRGANLEGAYLTGANLRGAYLYYNSHDFAMEIIRQQSIETFTDKEWVFIGQCSIHRFCYNAIKNKYAEVGLSVFKKLKKLGFGEYLEMLEK